MSQLLPVSTTEQEFIGLTKMGLLEHQIPSGPWLQFKRHTVCAACRNYDSGRFVIPQCRSCLTSGSGENWQFDSTVASKHVRIRGGDTSANQQEGET